MRINNPNVSFQGTYPTSKPTKIRTMINKILNYDTLDYATKNINPFMYGWMLMGVVIGSRYFQARDKDEKREILTRDLIGLSGYLFAMPILMKGIASIVEKKTGFLTSFKKNVNDIKENIPNKTKGFGSSIKGYVLQAKGYKLLSYANIKQTYVVDEKINNVKMSDFANLITKNTSEEGNHLYKILSFAIGKEKMEKELTTDKRNNAGIKEWLKNLEDAPVVDTVKKDLLETIKTQFKENGAVHKKAELLKSVPDLFALTSIITLLGWFLPWFNIHYTRALYKSGKNNPAAKQSTQESKPAGQSHNTQTVTNNFTESQRNLFSEFVK
ncbi:MAG: hypothetical protein PHC34_08055 [Candidatus Gastranaerophilales bacterium]|nr:hypothetical protein [Candidatus Gastranaerophilales bacterium]